MGDREQCDANLKKKKRMIPAELRETDVPDGNSHRNKKNTFLTSSLLSQKMSMVG